MARGLRSYIPNLFRFFQWLGKVQLRPLAVYCHHSQHWLFLFDTSDEKNIYRLPFSGSHFDFKKRQKVEWTLPSGLGINPKLCRSIHFFEKGRKHHLSFLYQEGSHRYLGLASSTNLKRFKTESLKPLKVNSLALVPSQGGYLAVFGKDSIGLAQSEDLNQWEMIDKQLIQARKDYFDSGSIRLLSAIERKEGILVLYDTTREHTLSIGAVIVAKSNPGHILWRSDSALWEEELGASSLSPLGVCADRGLITAYYLSNGGKILSTQFRSPFSRFREGRQSPSLKRSDSNPIIEPRKENGWEAEAAFNPAAWYDGNVVHLLYRAVGQDGVSRLGYASSSDGFSFDKRLPYPVLTIPSQKNRIGRYDPVHYPSGGSYGGAEDPRMAEIEGRIYVSMSAFDGWDFVRMAVVSLAREDFQKKNFSWTHPLFISPPGQIHKNWVLFPEKIKGKFAILHSIAPEISIEYVSDLEDLDQERLSIKSEFLPFSSSGRTWEHRMRGVGPPPLKTDKGWLLLYHAMDRKESHRYKMGAMLLDLKNPSKVLSRSHQPILEPDELYENSGKPGIIYACGSVIKDGELIIYYGGADRYTCAASANAEDFLNRLQQNKSVHLNAHKVSIH